MIFYDRSIMMIMILAGFDLRIFYAKIDKIKTSENADKKEKHSQ